MTDLERFFRRLVTNLAERDPSRLHHPIPLEDIHGSIVPYRTNRRALQLESSEDYELVLLRLCAGEDSLVRTEPEEARVRFEGEVLSPNPDLEILHRVENVVISLRSGPLERALDAEPDSGLAYAPAEPVYLPSLPEVDLPTLEPVRNEPLDAAPDDLANYTQPRPVPEPADERTAIPHCLYCGDALPSDRPVRFCPHCGQRQSPPECPQCHSEVDPGWRHCVSCGTALTEG